MTTDSSHRDQKSIPLSLSFYTAPELSFEELVEVAAEIGCTHVGLRLLDGAPTEPGTKLMQNPDFRRNALTHMGALGISALDASAARIRAETRASDFAALLDVSAEMGARFVMCSIDDAEAERSFNNLAELCDMAKPLGLKIGIEFVPWMSIGSLSDAARAVAHLQRANLGIVIDALHFDRSQGDVSELAALPPDSIAIFQICDAPRCTDVSLESQLHVATKERLLPGDGDIDLLEMCRALPTDTPVAMEIPMTKLSQTMPAIGRARRAAEATRQTLRRAQAAATGS